MKVLNARDLPDQRLTTTDEEGGRIYIHPSSVKGYYKKLKNFLHPFLIILFLAVPWIKIHGSPLLLLDFINRRFSVLGFSFLAQDTPLVIFFFLSFVLIIGFITALWGRIWCGWACPQTVFVESVFRKVEEWIEGDSIARRKLDVSEWNASKVYKKTLKWFFFVLITLVITHSFLAYFVGAEELAKMMSHSPFQNPSAFLSMLVISAIILFDFGWFREQFCLIACPYGRFQSVLMDEHSLVVGYDKKRGEPRRNKENPPEKEGDCVNCFRCVDVCPTGIDIRHGTQLECIACTACIDVCDEVMTHLKKPAGLIRYDSYEGFEGNSRKRFTLRAFIYLLLFSIVLGALSYSLWARKELSVTFIRSKGELPFSQTQEENKTWVLNHLKIDLRSKASVEKEFVLKLAPEDLARQAQLISAQNPLVLKPSEKKRIDVFVKTPPSFFQAGSYKTHLLIYSFVNGKETLQKEEMTLIGPLNPSSVSR